MALASGLDEAKADPSLAEHLGECAECAAELGAHQAVWSSLSVYEAPELGAVAGARMGARLASALRARDLAESGRQRPRWELRSWAVVTAAVLLGLGAGGWIGLGAKEMLGGTERAAAMPETHEGLLALAESVFDVAPPGSPASAWLLPSRGGDR